MTTGLGAVQQRSLTSAPPAISMDAPIDSAAGDEPFKVHLDAPVQRHGGGEGGDAGHVHAAAARGIEGSSQSLPFLDQINASFGRDMSSVQAHVGGAASEASASMGASAYATGNHVAFGSSPDLHTAAHEAAHVVQQAQGVSLYGGVGAAGDSYERNADAVADRVVAGESAADLLGGAGSAAAGGSVQKKGAREKEVGKGFVKYGGGSVKSYLTKLVEEGKISLTGKQIAILDAVAQVETGGQIGCIQTYDDQIVSIGFKQVVLGHGSLAKMMKKAPKGFANHGLSLDSSHTYKNFKKPPPAIAGVEDAEDLRGHEWGMKFYEASMEPDVVMAMCELALGELGEVQGSIKKNGGGETDYFQDTTALSWLLECKNNRPAFTPKAIKRAVDNGAKSAGTRDQFLNILGDAIVTTYEIEEPILAYNNTRADLKKKLKRDLTADEEAELLAKKKASHTKIGHRKGTNIITKISRKLDTPKVDAAPAKKQAAEQHADAPAEAAPPAPKPADEVFMSFPEPEPNACYPEDDGVGPLSLPEHANMSIAPVAGNVVPPAPPAPPAPTQSVAPVVAQIETAPAAQVAKAVEAPPPPPVAAEVAVPPAPPAPPEPDWSRSARAYHRKHSDLVEQFNAATNKVCCGEDGELIPNEVARWQAAHGVKPDGYCGPITVGAAVGNEPPPHAQAPIAPPPAIDAPTVAGPSIAQVPTIAPAPPTPKVPPPPSPTAAPDVLAPVAPKVEPKAAPPPEPAHDVAPANANAAKPQQVVKGHATRLVVKGGSQSCLVFVSPDGVTEKPDLFFFFHGYQADYGKDVDEHQDRPKKMKLYKSGADVAEQAMNFATGKNLIAILPQGNIGRNDEHGGHMKALEGGFEPFVHSVLGNIAKALHMEKLEPGHIGLAGHSAGGYEGIHQAIGSPKAMGGLADNITDVTLMDSAYSSSHFEDTRDWVFSGSPGKNVRIIGQAVQIAKNRGAKGHRPYFAHDKLNAYAQKRGFTIKELDVGEKRDTSTVIQHSQIINAQGQVHGDVIVLLSVREGGQGHHDIRDDVMDDAILSVGEGEAGNAAFDQDRLHPQQQQQAPQQPAKQAPAQAPGGGNAVAPAQGAQADDGHVQQDAPAPSDSEDDGSGNPVPSGKHVDGADESSKEPVQAPPIPQVAPPAPAPAPEGRGKLKFPSGTPVADRLYGAEGVARVEKLHRDNDTEVKGKTVHIHLDDEQWAFKQRCYAACVAHLGDQLFGGVAKKDLATSGPQMRHKASAKCVEMIEAFNNDPGKPSDEALKPGSAYRPPEEDFHLWDMGFNNIYLWKIIKWAKKHSPKDPWGDKVLKKAVHIIGERKAPPGGSNHSNGTAIDLKLKANGKWHGNKFDDQKAWEGSYADKWLKKNAKTYQFKNYEAEHWHYDYKGSL